MSGQNQPRLDDGLTELIYPPSGMLFKEEVIGPIFCKPKLIPLKSVTLEKLEKMQQEGLEKMKALEKQKELEAKLEAEELQARRQSVAVESDAGTDQNQNKQTDIWQANYD